MEKKLLLKGCVSKREVKEGERGKKDRERRRKREEIRKRESEN